MISRAKILIAVALLLGAFVYPIAVLNYLGPSTEYYEPTIQGATFENGKYYAYLGDRIFVRYIVVRHKINGNCQIHVSRYGENVGGPKPGKRHLLDFVELSFVGENELRRPHWPLGGLILGYGVNKDGEVQKDDPLIEPGENEQELALYVEARYYCNFLDYIFPRYLQGGDKPNETERVNIIIRRREMGDEDKKIFRVKDLIGAWLYAQAFTEFADGHRVNQFSDHPKGVLLILPNKLASHIVMSDNLPLVASGQLKIMTAAEALAIAPFVLAHYGNWDADEVAGTFSIKIEESSFANFNGVTQVRQILQLDKDTLRYVNPVTTSGTGAKVFATLTRIPGMCGDENGD